MTRALDDQRTDSALEEVLKVLDRLPLVSSVKRDLNSLRELLYQRRAPRIAVIGDEHAARLALLSALLGRDSLPDDVVRSSWVRLDARGALIELLDVPVDASEHDGLERALEEAQPDLVLLVLPAPDLDRAMARDLAHVGPILDRLAPADRRLAVLTRVDELPPADQAPPYAEGKEQMVDLTVQKLQRGLKEASLDVEEVLPISARDATGLAKLSDRMVKTLPERAHVEAARGLVHGAASRREVANRVVQSASTLALTVGMAPVPFSDAFVIAPLQVAMVSAVAHLGGRPWDRKAVMEWVASMGVVGSAGMGLRWTARQLLKLVPGAGTLVSAGVAGAGTVTMGQSAIAYFLRDDARRLSPNARG